MFPLLLLLVFYLHAVLISHHIHVSPHGGSGHPWMTFVFGIFAVGLSYKIITIWLPDSDYFSNVGLNQSTPYNPTAPRESHKFKVCSVHFFSEL